MPYPWYPEPSQSTFLPLADWEEEIGPTQPGGGASFSRDSGEGVLVGSIPFPKCRSARNVILGAAYVDQGTPWALHRLIPWRHPMYPEMRASEVHFEGYNPSGTSGVIGNATGKPWFQAAVTTDLLPRQAYYSRARTTVRFKPHPYLFLTDTELGGFSEYSRNAAVFDTLDPSLELLLADTGPFLKFAEGPQSGTDFPGAIPEYIAKCLFVLAWFDVPYEFVAYNFIPSKIMQCIGYLNDNDDWLNNTGTAGNGFPRGTLLLEAPRIRKKQQPIWTVNDIAPFMVDIFFPFKYFAPTPALGAGSLFKGWNLFPFARTGNYYSVVRKDTASTPFLGFKNFDAMFTHVRGPVTP